MWRSWQGKFTRVAQLKRGPGIAISIFLFNMAKAYTPQVDSAMQNGNEAQLNINGQDIALPPIVNEIANKLTEKRRDRRNEGKRKWRNERGKGRNNPNMNDSIGNNDATDAHSDKNFEDSTRAQSNINDEQPSLETVSDPSTSDPTNNASQVNGVPDGASPQNPDGSLQNPSSDPTNGGLSSIIPDPATPTVTSAPAPTTILDGSNSSQGIIETPALFWSIIACSIVILAFILAFLYRRKWDQNSKRPMSPKDAQNMSSLPPHLQRLNNETPIGSLDEFGYSQYPHDTSDSMYFYATDDDAHAIEFRKSPIPGRMDKVMSSASVLQNTQFYASMPSLLFEESIFSSSTESGESNNLKLNSYTSPVTLQLHKNNYGGSLAQLSIPENRIVPQKLFIEIPKTPLTRRSKNLSAAPAANGAMMSMRGFPSPVSV